MSEVELKVVCQRLDGRIRAEDAGELQGDKLLSRDGRVIGEGCEIKKTRNKNG